MGIFPSCVSWKILIWILCNLNHVFLPFPTSIFESDVLSCIHNYVINKFLHNAVKWCLSENVLFLFFLAVTMCPDGKFSIGQPVYYLSNGATRQNGKHFSWTYFKKCTHYPLQDCQLTLNWIKSFNSTDCSPDSVQIIYFNCSDCKARETLLSQREGNHFTTSKVSAVVNQEIFEHLMLPTLYELYREADFILQQDLLPAHAAGRIWMRYQKLVQWSWT